MKTYDPHECAEGQLVCADTKPGDLGDIRGTLDNHLTHATQIAHRIEDIGDRIFGSRPTSIAKGQTDGDRPPAPVSELVRDIGNTLARIEAALARF